VSAIRRARTLLRLLARLGTSGPKEVVDGVKKKWIGQVKSFADGIYPDWQIHFEQTGRRVPLEIRREFISEKRWTALDADFVERFLQWFHAKPEPRLVADMAARLDPVLKFTRFVAREFVVGKYLLAKNDSDVFDQFQLHYLALDGFILVSHDPDLSKRTSGSQQTARIMPFEKFLQSL
jgi:hypothetical protein